MSKSIRPSIADAMRQVSKRPAEETIPRTGDKKKLTIRLNPDTHEELRRLAFDRRRSIGSIVTGWIARGLDEERGR